MTSFITQALESSKDLVFQKEMKLKTPLAIPKVPIMSDPDQVFLDVAKENLRKKELTFYKKSGEIRSDDYV